MPRLTESKKNIVFEMDNAKKLAANVQIPGATLINDRMFALPYRHDTIKYLRNLGVGLENWHPIDKVYQFPRVQFIHEMYPHAKTTASKAVQFERGFILNDPRTGKTSAMIAMSNFLKYHEDTGSVLIVGPLSTITEGNVWPTEIKGMTPSATIGMLFGKNLSGNKRTQEVRRLLRAKRDYYIINPKGLTLPAIQKLLLEAVQNGTITKMFIDESTEFSNPSTQVWKAGNALSKGLRWFWMATGTPGSPMAVYGQAKMMNPNNPAVPSNKDVWKLRTMRQVTETKWVPKSDADEHIYKALTPAVRIKKRDVWQDMPDELIIPVRAELDPKVMSILKHLKDDGAVQVEGHEMIPANGGVAALRHIQISNGIFKITKDKTKDNGSDKDADYLRLPMKAKMESLLYLLGQTEGKTIVYTNYKETFNYLHDELASHGIESVIVNGSVSPNARGPIFEAFRQPGGPQVLIAHPLTVSYGVELATNADTMVWFGVPFIAPFLYQQAKERLFSGAQKSDVPTIYQLYSLPQELRGFKALEEGVDFSTSMADLFREDD